MAFGLQKPAHTWPILSTRATGVDAQDGRMNIMSHKIAEKLSNETGHNIEWAPANREYVIWPEGIPAENAREVRKVVAGLAAQERSHETEH